MRLIDADALERIILSEGSYQNMVGVLEEEIDNAPTIEIVLCMDCKRQKTCKFAQWQGNYGYCSNGETEGQEE